MKKAVSYLGLIAGGLLLAGSVQAQSGDLSYSYIEGGLSVFDPDGLSSEEGFNIRASAAFSENVYGFASWDRHEFDFFFGDEDFDNYQIGLGLNFALNDSADWFVQGSYLHAGFDDFDEDVFRADIGLRQAFSDRFEGRIFGGYTVGDFDEAVLGGDVLVKFTDQFGLSLGAETYEFDDTYFRANLRVIF